MPDHAFIRFRPRPHRARGRNAVPSFQSLRARSQHTVQAKHSNGAADGEMSPWLSIARTRNAQSVFPLLAMSRSGCRARLPVGEPAPAGRFHRLAYRHLPDLLKKCPLSLSVQLPTYRRTLKALGIRIEVLDRSYTNVLIEIANECDIATYTHRFERENSTALTHQRDVQSIRTRIVGDLRG